MIDAGDTVEFAAIGNYQLKGTAMVREVRQIRDTDGRIVNVYLVDYKVPDQLPGTLLLGDGEIVRKVVVGAEPRQYIH